jgi:hypothetical protein
LKNIDCKLHSADADAMNQLAGKEQNLATGVGDTRSVHAKTHLSEAKRTLMQAYVSGKISHKLRAPRAITARPTSKPALVSLFQEQLLLRENGRRHMPSIYNECFTIRMAGGSIDVTALERALTEIIRRHEIWRTTYDISHGCFVQVVHPPAPKIRLPFVDLRSFLGERLEEKVLRVTAEEAQRPFDLNRGPLLRFTLIRTGTTDYRLSVVAHLSIVDGISVYRLLPSELAVLYAAFFKSKCSPLPELPIQYADYAFWQRSWLTEDEIERQLAYWRKRLAGEPPALHWPTDNPETAVNTYRGEIEAFRLSPLLTDVIKKLSRSEGVTLFVVFLASFASLLYCYTSQTDVIIGTPSQAGRKRSEVASLLGYFLNPVALRINLQDDPSIRELLLQVKNATAEAMAYDDVPLEVIAKELHINGTSSRRAIFKVAISMQPQAAEVPGWGVTSMDASSGGAVWDLYLAFINGMDEIVGRAQYNPDVFEGHTIRHVLQDLQTMMQTMAADPGQRVSSLRQCVGLRSDRYYCNK